MPNDLSPRLLAVVEALPLHPGLRVLEIGPGPGAAAREVARRTQPGGYVLGVDRSASAVAAARAAADAQGLSRVLEFRCVAVEDLHLLPGEPPYDVAFAARVGALDGRHPELRQGALSAVRAALVPGGRLLVSAETASPSLHVLLG